MGMLFSPSNVLLQLQQIVVLVPKKPGVERDYKDNLVLLNPVISTPTSYGTLRCNTTYTQLAIQAPWLEEILDKFDFQRDVTRLV